MIGRHNKIEYSRARTRTVGFDSATHGVEPGSDVHVLERDRRSPFQLKELVLQAMRKNGRSRRVLTVNEGGRKGPGVGATSARLGQKPTLSASL